MLIRAAVSVILICVGLILLSACGLPLLIPPAHPDVYTNSFALWEQNDQGTLVPIGWGSVRGNSEEVRLELHPLPPGCLAGQSLEFTGRMLRTYTPTLHLVSAPQGGGSIFLDASLRSQPIVYGVNAIPFEGTLTFDGGCTGAKSIHVRAEEKPLLSTSFFGAARTTTHTDIQISETWNTEGLKAHHFYQYSASLLVTMKDCTAHGHESSVTLLSQSPLRFSITYLTEDNSRITEQATFDASHPKAPHSATYTIAGGPCDGESFTATLHPF